MRDRGERRRRVVLSNAEGCSEVDRGSRRVLAGGAGRAMTQAPASALRDGSPPSRAASPLADVVREGLSRADK
jgi:hypothetical protein